MFEWNDQRIKWYERAAEGSGYFSKIVAEIKPYLHPGASVCELACGLGYLSCSLAPAVKEVTAVDISAQAIDATKQQIRRHGLRNVTAIHMDWLNLKQPFDIVIYSYFNALMDHFEETMALANRYIISIQSNGPSNLKQNIGSNRAHSEPMEKETIENLKGFLAVKNIPYTLIERNWEFGQPLESKADAERFLKEYYRLQTKQAADVFLDENLLRQGNHYYLPKTKKTGIIIIDKERIPSLTF